MFKGDKELYKDDKVNGTVKYAPNVLATVDAVAQLLVDRVDIATAVYAQCSVGVSREYKVAVVSKLLSGALTATGGAS